MNIKFYYLPFLALILSISCKQDDEFEPKLAEITGCNTFMFDDESFELPSGRCETGATIDFDVTIEEKTSKFKIVCTGSCIESVESRE